MAGHSPWHNMKHRKAAVDAKRGKVFSKYSKLITSAARQGGGNINDNLKLSYAVEKARSANMPKDTIERAIKKGTGEIGGEQFEEIIYEGYAPGGVAVLIEALTDNRHRTSPEMKRAFEIRGGALGMPGSVQRMFSRKASFQVANPELGEEKLMEIALDAGAEDLKSEGGGFTIYADPAQFHQVKTALESKSVKLTAAEFVYIATLTVPVDAETGRKVIHLLEDLEDNDDVQSAYANFEMSEEDLREVANS
ncbi:MAG: YebC/PmpR family DNA-binding transcriptional regulator [Planctomycetes bacterium]|nr:YebC/PmpR family DNA-binding transcriptional regulator [Planctomycetota bacterium]